MTETVVDRLEVVEVDEHYGDPRPGPAAAQTRLVETIHEQRSIRQLGEVVAEHPFLELSSKLAFQRDVAHGDDQAGDVAVAEHVDDAHLEVARSAFAVEEDPRELLVRSEGQREGGIELAGDAIRCVEPERVVESPAE